MKNRGIKFTCAMLVVVLSVVIASPAMAAQWQENIPVTYGINLMFNNKPANLVTEDGNVVLPFVYKGTTYVPIRGVSYLFGADVDYDSSTNTAHIYDDFSEACALAYKMDIAVTQARLLASDECLSMITENFRDFDRNSEAYKYYIDALYSTLSSLWYLNDSNANVSIIINEILPKYNDFIEAFQELQKAYIALSKSPSSEYYTDQFIAKFGATDAAHSEFKTATDNFFYYYCTWRDF